MIVLWCLAESLEDVRGSWLVECGEAGRGEHSGFSCVVLRMALWGCEDVKMWRNDLDSHDRRGRMLHKIIWIRDCLQDWRRWLSPWLANSPIGWIYCYLHIASVYLSHSSIWNVWYWFDIVHDASYTSLILPIIRSQFNYPINDHEHQHDCRGIIFPRSLPSFPFLSLRSRRLRNLASRLRPLVQSPRVLLSIE